MRKTTSNSKKTSIKTKIIASSIGPIVLSVLVIGFIDIGSAVDILEETTASSTNRECRVSELEIDSILSGIEQSVETLASYIEKEIPSVAWLSDQQNEQSLTDSLYPLLDNTARHTPSSLTAYIRYNPDFTSPTSGLFLTRDSSNSPFQRVTPTDFSVYPKTDLEHVGWYYIPVNNGKPTWMAPYMNQNIGVLMISYVVPISIGGTSVGIVGMDMKINVVTDIVDRISYDGGYAFLTDAEGVVYNHPSLQYGTQLAEEYSELAQMVTLFSNDSSGEQLLAYKTNDGSRMNMAFTTLRNGMKLSLSVPETSVNRHRMELVKLNSIITLVIILIFGAQSFLIGNSITRPLVAMAEMLREISNGNGDLSKRLHVKNQDEIGQIANHFNTFMDFMHDMISQVKTETVKIDEIKNELVEKTGSVRSDAEMIAANINDLNFQTEEQSASVTETSATLQQIARNIENLTGEIDGQSAAVTQSSAAIQEMISNINSIASNLNKATDSFNLLKEASSEGSNAIGNVQQLVGNMSDQSEHLLETNSVINSIAEQTNLLAMNAAIEAAHAGESGKGFAVVADEIRKLAENSSTQSKDIASELNAIVDTIGTIVSATSAAETAFETVSERISMVNGLVSEITMAMSEQNEGSRQVLEALQNIQEITQNIQTGSQEMNSGTVAILNEINRLESVSQKVQDGSQEMARAVEQINQSIAHMETDAERNEQAVHALNSLTNQFTL